ncbi:MAG: outer membrane beta-barrel domain-containing protein [Bdellovibrionales bacterium]
MLSGVQNHAVKSATLLLLALLTPNLRAETVEFPDEELATETVVPVFEKVRSVLNRNVQTEGRFEFGGGMGMALNEPFYNPINFGASATYHLTDQHAVNVSANFFMSGLTEYGEQLKRGEGLTGKVFDATKAPAPKWMVLGHYQFTAYYGKISLSRQTVMNLTLFGLAGIGVIQTGGISNPALDVGFGQNFYFTPNLAARFDLKLLMYNGPDPTSRELNTTDNPAEDAFTKELQFKTYLSLGLVYLL